MQAPSRILPVELHVHISTYCRWPAYQYLLDLSNISRFSVKCLDKQRIQMMQTKLALRCPILTPMTLECLGEAKNTTTLFALPLPNNKVYLIQDTSISFPLNIFRHVTSINVFDLNTIKLREVGPSNVVFVPVVDSWLLSQNGHNDQIITIESEVGSYRWRNDMVRDLDCDTYLVHAK